MGDGWPGDWSLIDGGTGPMDGAGEFVGGTGQFVGGGVAPFGGTGTV